MTKVNHNRRLNEAEVRCGRTRLESKPLQVNIELTGVCDINPPCVFCSGKNFGHNYRPLDEAYLEKYASFLDACEHVNEDSFGEPLTHPGLVDVALQVTARGRIFSFVTNGLQLTRERADRLAACGANLGIHISVNAATAKTYYRLTGKSYDKLLKNIEYYVEAYRARNRGARPDVTLTFIVMKINKAEVSDFLRLAGRLGVKALLAPLHDRPSVPLADFGYTFVYEEEMVPYEELVEVGKEARRLAREIGLQCVLQWDARHDTAIRAFAVPDVDIPCLIPWRFLFIQEHRQQVFACPYHRHPVGTLAASTLEEIWNGEVIRGMRAELVRGDIPRVCWQNSSACPLIFEARRRGFDRESEDHITMGENDHWHLGEGWHHLERIPDPFRWTAGRASFRIRTAGKRFLRMEYVVFRRDVERHPMSGFLEVDGAVLGKFRIAKLEWQVADFQLPRGHGVGAAQVWVVTDGTWCPAEAEGSRDTRRLGIAVKRLWTE